MENSISRWRVSGHVLVFLILCPVLLASTAGIQHQFAGVPAGLFIGAITSGVTFVLTAAFVRWDRLRLEDVGAAIGKRSPLRFTVGFIMGLLLVALHTSILGFAGHVRWVRSEGVGSLSVLTTLIAYFLLSCREELAFHGYPLRRLNTLFGLWVSQSIIALVFAAEHVAGGSSWVQALFGAGMGSLLFGMASIATRGLAVPIGLHAAWNLGDWIRGGKDSTGLWHPVSADTFRDRAELVGMIGYVMVMAAATLAFWWFHTRQRGLLKVSSTSTR